MNSPLLAAMRQASVAISRERVTARRFIFSAQTLSASSVRFIAASRQPARAQHAFAETDDAGERVDDEKAAPRGLGDQQPAIIGAEIERAINRRRLRPRCAPVSFLLSAAAGRPWAGAFERARAATCAGPPPPQSPVSFRLALRSTRNHGSRARIAARPIHGVQPLTPEPPTLHLLAGRPVRWSYAV